MNLFLAITWLLLAAILYAYESTVGPLSMRLRFGGANISMSWVMLVLGLYNVARWYGTRMYRNEQRALHEALRQRMVYQRPTHREPPREPDPNFRFTDEPTPPAPPHQHDQPPSTS